jgi:DNA-directed RNA polymerase subunit RPC12/RpoP
MKLLSETLEEREERLARSRAKLKEKGNPKMETEEERELRLEDLKLIDEAMGKKSKVEKEEIQIKFKGGSSEDEEDPFRDVPKSLPDPLTPIKLDHAHKCSKCPRTFEFRSSLIVHELEHRPKIRCPQCPQLVFAETLEEHKKMHKKKKSGEEKGLKSQLEVKKEVTEEEVEVVKEEMISSENLPAKFKCDECKRKFSQKFQLLEHIFRDHRGDTKQHCLKCGFKTHCLNLMRIHRRSYKPKHVCEVCGWDFTLRQFLDVHRYRAHDVRNFSCEFCGKAFGLRTNLRSHQRINHGEDFNSTF